MVLVPVASVAPRQSVVPHVGFRLRLASPTLQHSLAKPSRRRRHAALSAVERIYSCLNVWRHDAAVG